MKRNNAVYLLFLSVILILTACSSSKINGSVEYGKFNLNDSYQSIYTEDGAYIIQDSNVFFYKDGVSQLLFTTYIIDDKSVKFEASDGESLKFSSDFQNYISKKVLDNIYIMGNRFYYISNFENKKGDKKYYLSSVNLLGKDRIDHILIEKEPTVFYIADDYFIIGSLINEKMEYVAYDKNLKEHDLDLKDKEIEAIYKSLVFYRKLNERDDYELWVFDIKTGEDSLFAPNTGTITAVGEGYIATFVSSKLENANDGKETNDIAKVYSIENRQEIFTLNDNIISNFDNDKFYALDTKTSNTYYEYDIKGNLISEVDGSNYSDIFHIISVKDGEAILNSNKAINRYYHIDFNSKKIDPIEVE